MLRILPIALSFTLLGLALSSPCRGQSRDDAAQEIRQSADGIWNQEQVQLKSEERLLTENLDDWTRRYRSVKQTSDDSQGIGKFGSTIELKPDLERFLEASKQQVAELKDASEVKCRQMDEIRARRSNNSGSLEVYRSEAHAVVGCKSLQWMYRNAVIESKLHSTIALTMMARINIASSVSEDMFRQELHDARDTLDDLRRVAEKDGLSTQKMLNLFLGY